MFWTKSRFAGNSNPERRLVMEHRKIRLLQKFITSIPAVRKELQTWASLAKTMPEPLRTQALSSIDHKAFHCIGGSVYAHYPGVEQGVMLRLVVALQTISDYLDNLCDRLDVTDPTSFRVLHRSFLHALTPGEPLENYYASYPYSEEKYLSTLVLACQKQLDSMPFYHLYQAEALRLATYYCELQVLKHVATRGDILLQDWASREFGPELSWNEWAAASGSTIGMFFLFALSFQKSQEQLEETLATYFPWFQGLHILLDYLIDLGEDEEYGDLNFVSCYPSLKTRELRLATFAQESRRRASRLPHAFFHETVVAGLIALYGSDPKVVHQQLKPMIKHLATDGTTSLLLRLCRLLRQVGYLP